MKPKIETFMDSVTEKVVPSESSAFLTAVWHGLRGEWNQAHDIVGDDNSIDACWIHAWLHREEGDLPNASYWYKRAKRPVEKDQSFAEEGKTIAEYLLTE